MTSATRPEDFGTTDCGDGLTIEKPAVFYVVRRDGQYRDSFPTFWEAMNFVEAIRGETR
jgi:hypothetical protein